MAANVRTGECEDATVSSLSRSRFPTGIRVAGTFSSTRRFGGTTARSVVDTRRSRCTDIVSLANYGQSSLRSGGASDFPYLSREVIGGCDNGQTCCTR